MAEPKMIRGWGAPAKGAPLQIFETPLPALKPWEVLLKVHSCGVCHSDIHLVDNDWGSSTYPLIPGHEIIGEVIATGSEVHHLKKGQKAGVGWQRGACFQCEECLHGKDNMCVEKQRTCVGYWGGYADYHVSDSRYTFLLPDGFDQPQFAPLLCGGITVFSPLCEFLQTGKHRTPRVGVVALGGLGHLAVKIAAKMGAEVTVFSSSQKKAEEAARMGAHHFVSSITSEEISKVQRKQDLIIVTANVDLPWNAYIDTLATDGTLCFVGIPPGPVTVSVDQLLDTRRRITASPIGSRARMAQMLEFCALHKIEAEVETHPMHEANKIVERVRKNQAGYRAVLVN